MHANIFCTICPLVALLSTLPKAAAAPASSNLTKERVCHLLPADAEWPSGADWNSLNDTVGGRLIRGIPLAQSCYKPNLDSAACAEIREQWTDLTP